MGIFSFLLQISFFQKSPIFVKMSNLTETDYFKVGCVLPMVISSEFRMGQYWEDDPQEDAPQFIKTVFLKYFLRNIVPPPCGEKWNYIRLLWRVFWSGLSTFQIIHFFHFISPRSRSVPVIKRRSSRLASFSWFRDSKLYRTGFDSRFMSHRLWVTQDES